MAYQSFLRDVQAQMNAARDAGLVAAGEVVRTEVKQGLAGGYTSGAFVTGESAANVKRTDPFTENNARAVKVYTELLRSLFWEVGHQNLFTGKFERVEVWFPALMSTAQKQADAYARVYARFMSARA